MSRQRSLAWCLNITALIEQEVTHAAHCPGGHTEGSIYPVLGLELFREPLLVQTEAENLSGSRWTPVPWALGPTGAHSVVEETQDWAP